VDRQKQCRNRHYLLSLFDPNFQVGYFNFTVWSLMAISKSTNQVLVTITVPGWPFLSIIALYNGATSKSVTMLTSGSLRPLLTITHVPTTLDNIITLSHTLLTSLLPIHKSPALIIRFNNVNHIEFQSKITRRHLCGGNFCGSMSGEDSPYLLKCKGCPHVHEFIHGFVGGCSYLWVVPISGGYTCCLSGSEGAGENTAAWKSNNLTYWKRLTRQFCGLCEAVVGLKKQLYSFI